MAIQIFCISFISLFFGCTDNDPENPNVLIIYADDLAFGDLQSYNPERGKIPTPNIDKLASEGMRFTDAHSSSGVCSPSRYTLLTGRYHWRSRLQNGIVPVFGSPLITPDRLTVAGVAKQNGYYTACIGKWHLGWNWPIPEGKRDMFLPKDKKATATDEKRAIWQEVFSQPIKGGPTAVGFDEYFGTDVPNWPPYCFIENEHTVGIPSEFGAAELFGRNQAGGQGPSIIDWELTEVLPALRDRTVDLIHRMVDSPDPFLIYLPLTSPHTPLAVNSEWKGKTGLGFYADLVMETDAMIGDILEELKKSGQAENTLVIFTSDNGCAPYVGNTTPEEANDTTFNTFPWFGTRHLYLPVNDLEKKGHFTSGPLRGYKSDVWEGGHRIPFIVRWPGKVQAGSVSTQLIHQADIMATIADVMNVELSPDAGEDSFSLLPILQGSDEPVRDYAVSTSHLGLPGIRKGTWKYIPAAGPGVGGWSSGIDPRPEQLYNLENDIGETSNLARKYPERVQEMKSLLEKMITDGRSNPGPKQPNDVEVVRFTD